MCNTPEGSGTLDRNGLEALFPMLADRLDTIAGDMREVFLIKAFLLLADAHGDARTALACLEEAATSGHVPGRGSGDDAL
jgi:hypothetical protein